MRRGLWGLVGLLLAGGAAGCGDTPRATFRDGIQVQNELADAMTVVDSDESAKDAKPLVERLKKKWERISMRMEAFTRDEEDAKGRWALIEGSIDTVGEASETSLRLGTEIERLKSLKHQLGGTAPAIDDLLSAPTTFDVAKLWGNSPVYKASQSMGPGGMQGGMPGGGMKGGMPGGGMKGGMPGGGMQGGMPPGGRPPGGMGPGGMPGMPK